MAPKLQVCVLSEEKCENFRKTSTPLIHLRKKLSTRKCNDFGSNLDNESAFEVLSRRQVMFTVRDSLLRLHLCILIQSVLIISLI